MRRPASGRKTARPTSVPLALRFLILLDARSDSIPARTVAPAVAVDKRSGATRGSRRPGPVATPPWLASAVPAGARAGRPHAPGTGRV